MISVLVVDDSVVIRRLITDALAEDPDIRVVGTAANGRLALTRIEQLQPDLITLDIEMPELDGIGTLRELRPLYPRLPVIMFSTLTAAGAGATLDALAAGASDYVTKPSNVGSFDESLRSVREQIIPRIHALCAGRGPLGRPTAARPAPGGFAFPPAVPGLTGALPQPPRTGAPAPGPASRTRTGPPATDAARAPIGPEEGRPADQRPADHRPADHRPADRRPAGHRPAAAPPGRAPQATPRVPARPRTGRVELLAVGCSTGGPDALSQVLAALPGTLPVPVVVVQHMPPLFTRMFAERLDRQSALTVVEAAGGEPLRPGHVYIAPGDHHLEVARAGTEIRTKLQSGPPENFCRPAVDVLFRSVAAVYGGNVLATILTGMGQDGRRGAETLHAAGAEIVAQDEATSVVWGMPGAVTHAGVAHAVLPLGDIARHLITRTAQGRGAHSLEAAR